MPKKPKPDREVVGPPAEGGHAEAKDDEAVVSFVREEAEAS